MDKLPKEWNIKHLGELCKLENGDRGKNYPSQSSFVSNGIPFINAGNLDNFSISDIGLNFISEEHFRRLSNGKFVKGDILFCLRGSLGKFAIVETEAMGAIASSLVIIRPHSELNLGFLKAYLQSGLCADMIRTYDNGSAQPNLAAASLKKFQIPLPPLSEQTRIVNRLDSLFERIDKSIALLEENIKHTEALMASVLDEVLTSSKDSIEISKLVIKTENVNPQNNPEVKYTYIDISSVNNKTHIIESPSELQGKDAPSRAKKSVVKGDIVFATTRPNLRNIAVIDSDYLNPIASTGFCVLRTNSGASTDFLFLCLLSNSIQEQIKPFIRGAQYPAISDKDLLQCKIPKLNLEEQINVSNKVMKIREKLALLMSEQQSKLSYLKALKASLLDKAFKGEL